MLVLAFGLWFLVRPYAGITQDALLYSFQAFSRLHPDSLGGDVFLAHTSQDSFTVFPAIHAAVIRLLGLERAALTLTLIGQIWWFIAAAFLARKLVGSRLAALSVALLAAMPGYYGAYEVFRYAEPFVTSRLFSEALVLTALTLMLDDRRVLAILAVGLAGLFHPLMAVAGVLLVASFLLGRSGLHFVSVAVMAGLAGAVIISEAHPVYPLAIFDPTWLALVRSRSPFLLTADWNPETWATVTRTVALGFLVAFVWKPGRERRLLVGVTAIGILGLVVAVVGASAFKIILLTQGQAWRWIWLTQVLAIMATVRSFPTLWAAGSAPRAALLLLMSAWLLTGWPAAVLAVLSCCVLLLGKRAAPTVSRMLLLASIIAISLCAMAYLASSAWVAALARGTLPLSSWRDDGVPAVIIVVICWWGAQRNRLPRGTLIACTVLMLVAGFASVSRWVETAQAEAVIHATFSGWREAIPIDAEVYWPTSPGEIWFILERRGFASHLQTAGILFSRETTMELLGRTSYTTPSMPSAIVFGDGAARVMLSLTTAGVRKVCRMGGADFVVSSDPFPLPEAATPVKVKLQHEDEVKTFHLFSCHAIRVTPLSAF